MSDPNAYPRPRRHLTEEELFRGYGADDSATLTPSADDVRRRLVSSLRREELEASGLPSRPTMLPTADTLPADGGRTQ